MEKKYKRVELAEREEISRGLSQGKTCQWIAQACGRHVSTISREIKRGGMTGATYRAARAQGNAHRQASRRKREKYKIPKNPLLREYIHEKLILRWSPEQIVNVMKNDYPHNPMMRISHETIYQYLYVMPKGELKKQLLSMLRHERKRRHQHKRGAQSRKPMGEMVSIDERPREVDHRHVPGHWEGDLLLGKNRQSALGSLVERKTRLTLLVPLKNRKASTVRRAFERELNKIPVSLKKSMTYDQGREMAEHKQLTKQTKMKVYFAHPASPWERGTNENTNGLIRQFFPKGTDFNGVTRISIKHVEDLLNGRPRRVLNFDTPYEVYSQIVALNS